ncbi:MAG: paraquat-inducible protein A [Phycisphaeraceae bacterium]|nr:paraquat-inducible protein A [Phycisphaeraceae bacterium]
MRTAQPTLPLRTCHSCGLLQRIPICAHGYEARCSRCRSRVRSDSRVRSLAWPAAFSLAALILFPVAMALPVLVLHKLGHARETTIWQGVVELLSDGHIAVGLIVLVCSVIIPPGKLIAMLLLCGRDRFLERRHQAVTYRIVDWLGRWGMIDVLLVAILVAAVKLGSWVDVTPGPGIVAFAGVVILSMLASAAFDPAAIWEDQSE